MIDTHTHTYFEKTIKSHSSNYQYLFLQDVARSNTESKPNKKEEFLDLLNGSESAFEDHKNNSKKDEKRQKMQRKRS